MDNAKAEYRDRWLHHPVIGDPSWDTFQREPNNPLFIGKPPFEWPVNGFLFLDPPTRIWYAYIGLYPKGYWPAGGCLLLKETQPNHWENLGIVMAGSKDDFSGDGIKVGGTPDVHVSYDGKKYHMVYDWGDPQNKNGGIAYAVSDSPEGPFLRHPTPIHAEFNQPFLNARYKRVYAASLFRRNKDWIVLAMMSTPGNAGGTWALISLVAPHPEGPWSEPTFLLHPQSGRFHPPLMEFYPAFMHNDIVYAPATSVGKNRNFQAVFMAPLEHAHEPQSWTIAHYGSVWHDRPGLNHEQGIWGQTIAGQICEDTNGELRLRVLSFSKTDDNIGTVHVSNRPWNTPYGDTMHISAAYGKTYAILPQTFGDFTFNLMGEVMGDWSIGWDCNGPLGPDRNGADAKPHPLMETNRKECHFSSNSVEFVEISPKGRRHALNQPIQLNPASPISVSLQRYGTNIRFQMGSDDFTMQDLAISPGRIEISAEKNTLLKLEQFKVEGVSSPRWNVWLPEEALIGAGSAPGDWKAVKHSLFRFGMGYTSQNLRSMGKWNVIGSAVRLWAPKHPRLGKADIIFDGQVVKTLDFSSPNRTSSNVVWEFKSTYGNHAIILHPIEGNIPCDCLDVLSI